jgi:hypothetical protein
LVRVQPGDCSLSVSRVAQHGGMTILWFIVWLIADVIGEPEGLTFNPVNFWAGWLLLSLALDLGAVHARR